MSPATEESYPFYSGHTDIPYGPCEPQRTNIMVSECIAPERNNVSQMKAALATQPLSVSSDMNDHFRYFKTGIFDDTSCGDNSYHAMLLVGWGNDADSGLDYWLIKNSFATNWGDKGYIKMAIVEGKGICGIQ